MSAFIILKLLKKKQDSFSDIAWLMADFFNDLDLVPTDIVTGLILLRKQQKKMQQLTTATPPSQSTTDTVKPSLAIHTLFFN